MYSEVHSDRVLLTCFAQVEAFRGKIIMPNRHEESHGTMYEGHLVASETYVGGHVEALEAGVFRSDIETHFKIEPSAVQQVSAHVEVLELLIDNHSAVDRPIGCCAHFLYRRGIQVLARIRDEL